MNTIIPTDNGYSLFAEVFYPETALVPQQVLIVNAAMGIGMEFYFPFARYVSSVGIAVVTYDYHPVTDRTSSNFRKFNDAIIACGSADFDAVVTWTSRTFPGHEIHALGHGMGGTITGFAKAIRNLKTLITVGAQIPTRSEITSKNWLNVVVKTATLRLRFFLTHRFPMIKLNRMPVVGHRLHESRRLRFESPDVSARVIVKSQPNYFATFQGRLLTAVIPDDELFNADASERLQHLFTNAKTATRFLYPEEFDVTNFGFFGFFLSHNDPSHWEMTTRWMLDTLPIIEEQYALFNDEELPIVVIQIAHRDPTSEMIDEYLSTLKNYFERSPIYMIMDMSRVHWANARFLKNLANWVKTNHDLVKKGHKGTAYACANPFIRYFISVFHAMDIFGVIKPVVVFRTVEQAKKWAYLQIEKDSSKEMAYDGE